MKKKKVRAVTPVYSVAAIWLLYTLFHGIYGAADLIAVVLISVVAFFFIRSFFPTKVVEVPVEEKKETTSEKKREPEPAAPKEDPEITALKLERDRAISEMRRLNDNIKDPKISSQIDHLEVTTSRIFEAVIEKPERKSQIRSFFDYFLPTTIKLLNAYDRADASGISGSNVDGTKKRVEEMLSEIEEAFDRQLDNLFGAEAMDIAAEIKVMETMLSQEGLSDDPFAAASH